MNYRKSLSRGSFLFSICLSFLLFGCAPAYDRYMSEGQSFLASGDFAKAHASFHKATQEARKSSKKKTELIAALTAEADCLSSLKRSEEELAVLEQAAILCEKDTTLGYKKAATFRKRMGDVAYRSEDGYAAFEHYKTALNDLKSADAEKTYDTGMVLCALGDLKFAARQFKEAGVYYEASCEVIQEANEPRTFQQLGQTMMKLAATYRELNMEDEAGAMEADARKVQIGGTRTQIKKMLSGI